MGNSGALLTLSSGAIGDTLGVAVDRLPITPSRLRDLMS
jgi:hypothetical protein